MVNLQEKLPQERNESANRLPVCQYFMFCWRLQSLDSSMTTEKMLSSRVVIVRLADVTVVQLGGEENY